MFVEAIIIGVIIGVILNGRISNLYEISVRGWYLIIIGLGVQYIPLVLQYFKIEFLNYGMFSIAGNIIIILVLLVNFDIKGMLIIMFGGILNLVGLFLNGFKMPILKSGISSEITQAIINGEITNYKLITELDNWKYYFGKFIKLPEIYPFAKVLSIGDIVITIGIIVLVALEMRKVYFDKRDVMLKFAY